MTKSGNAFTPKYPRLLLNLPLIQERMLLSLRRRFV
jgi:hypothetical protein